MPNKLEVSHVVAVAKAIGDYLDFTGEAWQAIAAQLILEKGWAWWAKEGGNWNIGNVTNGGVGNGFASYTGLLDAESAYVSTLENGDYTSVIDAGKTGDLKKTLQALASSPWSDPPYGNVLTAVWETFDSLYVQWIKDASVPASGSPVAEGSFVTVTEGPPTNTLWGIAEKEYGSGLLYPTLLRLNPGIQPRGLIVGQKVRVR